MQAGHAVAQANAASGVLLLLTKLRPGYFIVLKSALRRNWSLVRVAQHTGALQFSFTKGRDVFETQAEALNFVKTYHGPYEVVGSGKHVLGYVVVGSTGLLLIAEKVRTACTLPGNHEVKSVSVSRWHRMPLQENEASGSNSPVREEQARGIDKLTTFPIDGTHFFCETMDLTRPFPSSRPVFQPSWEFVWNRWLSTSWRSIGLEHVCPPLLQGMCEVRTLRDFDGAAYQYALLSRRSRLHVGPRYKARGLNEVAEPGNEIECEQVIWRPEPGADLRTGPILWSRYCWRRGSVPLWWGVKIKNNGMGEAEIKIQQSCTFKGSRRYARRLQRRYAPDPHLDPDEPANASARELSLQVPLVYVSLLRKGNIEKDRSETKLASAFDAMAGALRKEHRMPLTYIALDWHEMDKALGHEAIVEGFWGSVRDVLPKHGFALGTMHRVGPDHTDTSILPIDDGCSHHERMRDMPRCHSPAGKGWEARWFRQQRGIMRYNCADSLDRTNVSSFFGAIQVMVEQCRELDIAIALCPKGVNGVAALMRKPSVNGTGNASRPSTPAHGARGAADVVPAKGGISAFKDTFNKSLLTLMYDIKTPRGGAAAGGAASIASPWGGAPAANGATPQQPLRTAAIAAAAINGARSQQQAPPPTHSQSGVHGSVATGAGGSPAARLLASIPPLPAGWEAKVDSSSNRVFYVDHNTKTTTWEPPARSGALPHGPGLPLHDSPPDSAKAVDGDAHDLLRSSTPHAVMAAAAAAATAPPACPVAADPRSVSKTTSIDRNKYQGWAAAGATPAAPSATPLSVAASASLPRSTAEAQALGAAAMAGAARPPAGAGAAQSFNFKWEPLSPWCMLSCDASACRRFQARISPDALSAIAELFLINGDLSAWLYTGSQAMHSERMLIFEPADSKLRKAGIGHYDGMLVALKRRFNNVWADADKQMQMDLFLGLKHKEYFGSTPLLYREDSVIPLDHSESGDEEDPVGRMCWPTPDKNQEAGGLGSGGGSFSVAHTRRYSSMDFMNNNQSGVAAANGGGSGNGSMHGPSNLRPIGSGALVTAAANSRSTSDIAGVAESHPASAKTSAGGTLSKPGSVVDLPQQAHVLVTHDRAADAVGLGNSFIAAFGGSLRRSSTPIGQAVGGASVGMPEAARKLSDLPSPSAGSLLSSASTASASGLLGHDGSNRCASGEQLDRLARQATNHGSGSATPDRPYAVPTKMAGGPMDFSNVAHVLRTGFQKLADPLQTLARG